MRLAALAAAIFGALAVVLALSTGAAGGGGRFRRAEEPLKYWAIIAAGLTLSGALFLASR
jgi:hypothetical protein